MCLRQRGCRSNVNVLRRNAPRAAGSAVRATDPEQAPATPCAKLYPSPERLDKTTHHLLIAGAAEALARDGLGSPRRSCAASVRIREAAHVQFNSALIYSGSHNDTGRSFSGA